MNVEPVITFLGLDALRNPPLKLKQFNEKPKLLTKIWESYSYES